MERRKFLVSGGAVLTTTIAGCAADEPSGEEPQEEQSGDSNGENGDSEQEQEEFPDPIESEYSGSGSDVVDGLEVELLGPTVFAMEHGGGSNFAVELYDSGGNQEELLANEVGRWVGANGVDVVAGEYALDVEADGEWEIEVTQYPQYPGGNAEFPYDFEGNTDNIYGPVDFSESRTLSLVAEGDGNNIVMVRDSYGAMADLVVNEVGPVEGSSIASIDDNAGWIDVEMGGPYELTIEE